MTEGKVSRRLRRPKIIPTEVGNIQRLRDGRFRIDCRSNGGPRLILATLEEAKAKLSQFAEKKSRSEIFRASSTSATFGDALELLRTRPRERRLTKGSRDGLESVFRLLQSRFGTYTLKALVEAELRPMQDFFIQLSSESESNERPKFIRTVISQALKIAVGKHWLTVHPLDQFELVVPFKERPKRPVLSIAQISALARAALLRTKQDRLEITWSNRQLLFFLTLLTPMRNEEAAGLCWDCLDMFHRTFLIKRIVREGDDGRHELVDDTKTGQSGERTAPMPPFLVPVIEQHRQRLIARGMRVEGRVPLMVSGQRLGNGLVTSAEITRSHFPTLAAKAGVKLPSGLKFYIMRHTATNLLKSVGMDRDDLLELGGWTESKTFDAHYRSPTPEYKQSLRPEVEAMALRLGLDLKCSEGLVDALGYVLVARWHHEGIKVQMAQPRQRQRSPLEAALLGVDEAAPPALPRPVLEDTTPTFPSVEAVRRWQIGEAVKLYKEGWTRTRIAAYLKVDGSTVGSWLRDAEIPHTRGSSGISYAARAERRRKLDELHVAHPEWSNDELGRELELRPTLVSRWLRKSGAAPAPRKMPAYKLGKDEARILVMVEQGKTLRQMAKVLGVSFSAIALFLKKRGVKTKHRSHGQFGTTRRD